MRNSVTLSCGHEAEPMGIGDGGYCITADDRKLCYNCGAERQKAAMQSTGMITLYLAIRRDRYYQETASVTDWPGVLRFPVERVRRGHHNMAGERTDVWFTGPDGYVWHGVTYGVNTELVHCKRTKAVAS